MDNIYKTPESKVGRKSSIFPTWKRALATIFILPPVHVYYWGHKNIPQFMETYSNFNADLPPETIFVLNLAPYFVWGIPFSFIPLLIWRGRKLKYKHKRMLFVGSSVHALFSVLMLFLILWAIYSPLLNG